MSMLSKIEFKFLKQNFKSIVKVIVDKKKIERRDFTRRPR